MYSLAADGVCGCSIADLLFVPLAVVALFAPPAACSVLVDAFSILASLSASGSYSFGDSTCYVCLNKNKSFVNVEDDIAYFKAKEEVIIFGDINSHTNFVNFMHNNLSCHIL